MAEEAIVLGIHKKVLELQKRVGVLKKDATNAHFKYNYASALSVNETVKALLSELGIVAQLSTVIENVTGDLVVASSALTLIDPEDGSEMSFQGIGSGKESTGKAAMLACTASSKYATIAAVFGATGDDPEAADDKPQPSTKPGSASVGIIKPPPAQQPAQGETIAAVVNSFEEITRNGKQPFKINTDQGIFQSFDRKVLERIKAGSIVIYRVGRWGNDVVEVKNKDEQLELPEAQADEAAF
jgi:hypothetical protein